MHLLYEQLENAGILRDRRVDERQVRRLSASRIAKLAEEAAALTSADDETREKEASAHTASLSLGGGYTPCGELRCRRRRIDELARFAALYSDKVYINNFLADHSDHGHGVGDDLGSARESFLDDVRLLAHIRPLVEAGRITPISMPVMKCPHCIAADAFGKAARDRSVEAQQRLLARYLDEVQVTLEDFGGVYDVNWEGPRDLLEHGGGGRFLDELPAEFLEDSALLDALRAGEVVKLDRHQREVIGIHGELTADVLRSLSFEMAVSQALQASFVTEFDLEIAVLNRISADPGLALRNRIVEKHLTSLVPFAGDVPVARLLELRRREEESFLVFRKALNEALDAYRAEGGELTERRAQELFQDVIAPQLARLDQKVKAAKRGIASKFARDAAGWTAAITVGIWTGVVPAGAVAAAKLLGLTKVAADMVSAGLKARSGDSEIATEEYYFLWKVRQIARS